MWTKVRQTEPVARRPWAIGHWLWAINVHRLKSNIFLKRNQKYLKMSLFKKTILPILLATVWISLSEFVRNEFLAKSYWTNHYESLGLTFPSEPVNGAVWGLWSLLFAIAIYVLSKKFSLLETTLLSWFVGFVLMWVVVGNLGVLPFRLLYLAVPLSLLEAFLAAWIIFRLGKRP